MEHRHFAFRINLIPKVSISLPKFKRTRKLKALDGRMKTDTKPEPFNVHVSRKNEILDKIF